MRYLLLIAVTAGITWLAVSPKAGKVSQAVVNTTNDPYVQGVQDLSGELVVLFGSATRQSEDVRRMATKLLTAHASASAKR